MAMRLTTRTTVRFASREEKLSSVTLVQEPTTLSVWTPSWKRHLRENGAAHTV